MSYIETVAAYVRVSTQEQKMHGLSIEAQKMKLKEFAKKNNMKIVKWYVDEGVSARRLIRRRPELQKMIHESHDNIFTRIIFIKLDRYFRSVAEYHECQKILDVNKVTWTATEEKYDLTTANGRAFVNMKITIAELEVDTASERISIVNDYKIKQGLPLFGEQCLPFCYTYGIVNNLKRTIKHPEYEELTHDLINYFLQYQSKRGTVLYINKKYNKSFRYNAIDNLLKNTMLYGEYKGNPNYIEKPYIDKATFDRIQDILTRNCKKNTTQNRNYLFSGLLACPECGNVMAGNPVTRKNRKGENIKYKYYRCQFNNTSKICSFGKVVSEKKIEEDLINNIAQLFENYKLVVHGIVPSDEEKIEVYDIGEIQQEIERLNYSWRKNRLTQEAYDRDYDELMQKMAEAVSNKTEITEHDFSHIEEILNNDWPDLYDALNEENKKAFWRSFIEKIKLEDNRKIKNVLFF